MEMKEVIKLWKEAEIDHAEFNFSCGGDSMNDTELIFYKENKQIEVDGALYDYFDNSVYDNVEFYVDSCDNYIGENGTVTIELNEEEDGFEYGKSSTEEWLETCSDTLKVEITKEQAEFLQEYVRDMSGGGWRGEEINYKKDFILTAELEKMIQELHDAFEVKCNDWAYNQGEYQDETEFYETDVSISEEDGKFFVDLDVSCEIYSFT